MIFKRMAVAALACAVFAWPAAAQQPPAPAPDGVADADWKEMTCVYEELMVLDDEEYFGIVDAHLSNLTEGDLYDSAMESVLTAVDACVTQYSWNADRTEVALIMGIYGAVADAIEGEFLDEGLTEKQIDNIVGLVDTLSDDDIDAFISGDWRDDAALNDSLKARLKGQGVPNDATLLDHGVALIEAYVMSMIQMEMWISG